MSFIQELKWAGIGIETPCRHLGTSFGGSGEKPQNSIYNLVSLFYVKLNLNLFWGSKPPSGWYLGTQDYIFQLSPQQGTKVSPTMSGQKQGLPLTGLAPDRSSLSVFPCLLPAAEGSVEDSGPCTDSNRTFRDYSNIPCLHLQYDSQVDSVYLKHCVQHHISLILLI